MTAAPQTASGKLLGDACDDKRLRATASLHFFPRRNRDGQAILRRRHRTRRDGLSAHGGFCAKLKSITTVSPSTGGV